MYILPILLYIIERLLHEEVSGLDTDQALCSESVGLSGTIIWYRSADGSEEGKVVIDTSNSTLYTFTEYYGSHLHFKYLTLLYPTGVTRGYGGLYSCDINIAGWTHAYDDYLGSRPWPELCVLVYSKFLFPIAIPSFSSCYSL